MSDEQGTFVRVGEGAQRMHGPTGALLCGFSVEGQAAVVRIWAEAGLGDIPVRVATEAEAVQTCLELLTSGPGPGRASGLPRAVLVSGLLESQLHQLMGAYRAAGAPRALWAALTPHSEAWPLAALLAELEEERKAVEDAARKRGGDQ